MRRKLTTALPQETVDRLRATVAGLKQLGHYRVTVAGATADALTVWCETQEQQYNRGERFPTIAADLPPGRPGIPAE